MGGGLWITIYKTCFPNTEREKINKKGGKERREGGGDHFSTPLALPGGRREATFKPSQRCSRGRGAVRGQFPRIQRLFEYRTRTSGYQAGG